MRSTTPPARSAGASRVATSRKTVPAGRVRAGDAVTVSSGPPRGWVRRLLGRRRRHGDAVAARPNRAPYLRAFTAYGLVAVDPLTGAEAWRVESAGYPITDPVLGDGRLYFVGRASPAVALYAYAVGGAWDAGVGA